MILPYDKEVGVALSQGNDQAQAAPVLAFIGGGQMASALMEGLLRSGWSPGQVLVLEPNDAQRGKLDSTLGVRTLAGPDGNLREADVVVWAVKPQVMQAAIGPVRPLLQSPLHISICAGLSTGTLSRWLASERVIRAMPNTPALVGAGVTGMHAMPGVSASDRSLAESLFGSTGMTFWVDSDERIDAVTAVSGSGPGYVFEFVAAFQSAAEQLGFSERQARVLALRTAIGALTLAAHDDAPLAEHRDRVASKGGTTEAGLEMLSRHDLLGAMQLSAAAAYRRAQELSKSLDQ
ncbi:MAG: pyrroline-5-carboxylate reductase [Ramlibacter sp.]|nr:pyrroline-5-carboxylate reductase [Ramlibacter sp.]